MKVQLRGEAVRLSVLYPAKVHTVRLKISTFVLNCTVEQESLQKQKAKKATTYLPIVCVSTFIISGDVPSFTLRCALT